MNSNDPSTIKYNTTQKLVFKVENQLRFDHLNAVIHTGKQFTHKNTQRQYEVYDHIFINK